MLKKQGGFSLVQVLMSIGLLSALGLGVAQLIQDSNKAVNKMEVDADLLVVYRSIMSVLSDPLNCAETFRNRLAANTPNATIQIKKDVKGVFVNEFPANQVYGSKQLKILSYSLSDAAADVDVATKNTTHLIIEFDRGMGKVGSRIITKKIVLNVQVDASNRITSCSAHGETGSDIWKYSANQSDIFFSGGNVGINTSTPAEKLHIYRGNAKVYIDGNGGLGGPPSGMFLTGNNITGQQIGLFFGTDGPIYERGLVYDTASARLSLVNNASSATRTPRLVVKPDGNIGIGEIDPNHLLSLKSHGTLIGNNAQIMIRDPDNLSRGLGIGYEQTNAVQTFAFLQTSFDGMGLYPHLVMQASGGNVGIGTTTASHKLDVVGTNGTTVAHFSDGSQSCSIRPATSGNITCSSDERLKKNIKAFSNSEALRKILKLQTVTFEWKSLNDGAHTGYIAQAVEKIIPELVSTDKSGYKQIGQMGLIPWITSAIKELYTDSNDRIKKLEAENAELRIRVERIEKMYAAKSI
ncbi:tail fiber domain-containing protein [Peredibacter starrii]|uniref:Tail fiber domain-containing protein n=1 Tax=Peredibacter starrii TaxID=28202 RepID=A0AAX4HS09_9BACT|nr:tail fiber domain-containing protein [Peredibacter starrii]WPU66011.1 tail fiber domain-containing protein [Peredibacter starrii]